VADEKLSKDTWFLGLSILAVILVFGSMALGSWRNRRKEIRVFADAAISGLGIRDSHAFRRFESGREEKWSVDAHCRFVVKRGAGESAEKLWLVRDGAEAVSLFGEKSAGSTDSRRQEGL
jgi:hypothetical protein